MVPLQQAVRTTLSLVVYLSLLPCCPTSLTALEYHAVISDGDIRCPKTRMIASSFANFGNANTNVCCGARFRDALMAMIDSLSDVPVFSKNEQF